MSEWEFLLEYLRQFKPRRFETVFDEHGRITGVVWVRQAKKQPRLKTYQAGADATRV